MFLFLCVWMKRILIFPYFSLNFKTFTHIEKRFSLVCLLWKTCFGAGFSREHTCFWFAKCCYHFPPGGGGAAQGVPGVLQTQATLLLGRRQICGHKPRNIERYLLTQYKTVVPSKMKSRIKHYNSRFIDRIPVCDEEVKRYRKLSQTQQINKSSMALARRFVLQSGLWSTSYWSVF